LILNDNYVERSFALMNWLGVVAANGDDFSEVVAKKKVEKWSRRGGNNLRNSSLYFRAES